MITVFVFWTYCFKAFIEVWRQAPVVLRRHEKKAESGSTSFMNVEMNMMGVAEFQVHLVEGSVKNVVLKVFMGLVLEGDKNRLISLQ